jgi:hypothetical protein
MATLRRGMGGIGPEFRGESAHLKHDPDTIDTDDRPLAMCLQGCHQLIIRA